MLACRQLHGDSRMLACLRSGRVKCPENNDLAASKTLGILETASISVGTVHIKMERDRKSTRLSGVQTCGLPSSIHLYVQRAN